LAWTKAVMAKLGLTLNEAKTSVKDARSERRMEVSRSAAPRIAASVISWRALDFDPVLVMGDHQDRIARAWL
jgi:hypothetical protein